MSQSGEVSEWGGKYAQETICGLTGTTVILNCSFWYPQMHNGQIIKVERTLWFTKGANDQPEDLRKDFKYTDRLDLNCQVNWCTLSIRELRKSDEGKYKFKFITNATGGQYTVMSGVTLKVTDLNIQKSWWYRTPNLSCHSECDLDSPSYIWYENGRKRLDLNSKEITASSNYLSYSCALRGHEQHLSPPVCWGPSCDKVVYLYKSICALKGSDVDIACTYGHHKTVREKSWFRPDNGNTWNVPSVSSTWQLDQRYFTTDVDGKRSGLLIKNVTESDSAEYRFKFSEWGSDLPGTILTVTAAQVQVIKAENKDSDTVALLSCHTSCSPASYLYWCWVKDGHENVGRPTWKKEQIITLRPGEYITCAVENYPLSVSPPLYALEAPRVLLSNKSDILEGDLLTLTCIADTPTSSRHRWYKKCRTSDCEVMRYGEKLVFSSIQSSDSAEYFCAVENDLGEKMSQSVVIDVKYAPRFSNLLVSPSNVTEGQPVNLTCSSDANPAASYTWYKDQTMLQGSERNYVFNSIRAEDGGSFYCKAHNKYGNVISSQVVVDIQYVPRLPSISARPFSHVSMGFSVRLTCTSDANPAASYFWFKDNEESPNSMGAVFNIINFQLHNEGAYHCEARNVRGSRRATLLLREENFRSWLQGALTVVAVRYAIAGILLILLIVTVLLFWKKTTSKGRMHFKSQPNTSEDSSRDQLEELMVFSEHSPIHSNVTNNKTDHNEDDYENVVDTVIKCGGQASG
ncbi:B-cell receptor CD22-like isoform X2 [Corythoichthys intestinalis]|uniref:B-cell receptor CD22-like isoform X2 n=1 Tax=Corythoichthys intestinalis TaxID=161448 RepID=UPI0025A54CF4|nr:B-cell receptor CD22-like isoform X2 [Corythoichthys intestinalis]